MIRRYLFLLVFYFLFACSNNEKWQGSIEVIDGVTYIHNPEKELWNDSKKIVFKKVLSIGELDGDENYVLARPYDVRVNRAGDIYIIDFMNNCVKVYDRNGNYVKKIGQFGSGPGELYGPKYFDLDSNDNVYIYEAGNLRISIFSSNGVFLNSFKYKEFESPNRLKATPDGQILIAALNIIRPLENMIYQYNHNGLVMNAFGKPFLLGKSFHGDKFATPCIALLPTNTILCALAYPYEIRKYNLDGKLTSVITRESPMFTEPLKTPTGPETFTLMSRFSISDIIVFPDGKFLLKVIDIGKDYLERYKEFSQNKDYSKPNFGLKLNWSRRYDLYDSEFRFLHTFSLDKEMGKIAYIDSEGYVYTVSDMDQIPHVCKYSISFENL